MSELVLHDIVLDRVIGRGGMAAVWKGYARGAERLVAVKILDRSDNPVQLRRFHDEIRAVARLRHVGIVDVLEMGLVPDSLAGRGPGLIAGSPWLAMEYVSGGTLRDLAPRLTWRDARSLLSQILDALGHAHARGIVHRDLKPANVLVTREQHGYCAWISDFGLAHTRGLHERDSEFEERVAGTPRFMSPEQIEGRWRDHGPWTDLYALGCIAYWLACGRSPFGGDDIADILRGHLYGSVQPLEEEHELPEGFDRWVGNLLRKQMSERYRFAADAAFGLHRLGGIDSEATLWEGVEVEPEADVTEAFTQREWASVEMRRFKRSTLQIVPGTVETPPIPRTWRGPERERVGRHEGLSLFRLRTPPMVGREQERDRMWETLRAVHGEGTPRCLVLTGRSGTGKSRLARWTGNRAMEVGAATKIVATHAAGEEGSAGIGAMFARHLECFGLSLQQVENRLRDWWAQGGRLDHQALHDVRVLARFMPVENSEEEADGTGVTLGSSLETFERALRVLAADRPVYLWLDDVHWSTTSIHFAHWLVRQSQLPVLIVATVQSEAMERRDGVREPLDDLLAHSRTAHLPVERLGEEDHRALVESMLPLEPGAVDEVARRTAGDPLFAVQMLGQCVDRGLFVTGQRGLRISHASRAVLPDDVRGVWLDRVQQAVVDLDEPRREKVIEAFELAAALGAEVQDVQWRHACNLADLAVDESVVERFLDARLIERSEGRWSFVHSTLREVLEQRARAGGRWRRLCRACAESVRWFGPQGFGERARRRARYFMQAGELRHAARSLLAASREKLRAGRYEQAERLRQRHEALCDELTLEEGDPQRLGNSMIRARAAMAHGELDEAVAWAKIAVDGAREGDESRSIVEALILRGDVMRHRDVDEAIRAHDEASELADPASSPELHAWVLLHAAETRCFHRVHETAATLADQAIELATRHGFDPIRAEAHFLRAIAIRQRGDYPDADREVGTAHRLAEDAGRPFLAARCELEASLINRLDGELNKALRWGQRARNSLRSHGPKVRAQAELEVYLSQLPRSRPERITHRLAGAIERATLPRTDVRGAEVRFRLAALAVERGAGDETRRFIDAARPAVEVGAFDRAMAIAIDGAADAVANVGDLELAEELWALGRSQWRELGTTTVSPE